MLGRRRRVSRTKKKQDEEDAKQETQVPENFAEEQSAAVEPVDEVPKEKVRKSETKHKDGDEPTSKESEKKASSAVALVHHKASSKKQKLAEDEAQKEEAKEWGSKQPKQVDVDILKYALTVGGEIAQKAHELQQLESSTRDPTSEETANRIKQDGEELTKLRSALFNEIREGEASLACDKRGSRVLQNLVKDGATEQVLQAFERVKPYVGHLIYDPFASHVLQAFIDRCSLENASSEEKRFVSEFCAQISKANEWWAMMHDTSATHIARTCALALERIADKEGQDALYKSLKAAPQSDIRSAARNPQAGPFLAVAISSLSSKKRRETVLRRLFSDERNELEFDRKQFDSCIQDKIGSRVMDQCVPRCSEDFIENVFFNQGLAAPFLQRSAKHPFANYVVQRVLENLRSVESFERAVAECPVKEMLDFDRVGVLTAIAKGLGATGESAVAIQTTFCDEFVKNGGFSRAIQHIRGIASEGDKKQDSTELEEDPKKKKSEGKEHTPVQVHLALTETIHQILIGFSNSEAKQPVIDQLLNLDQAKLVRLACDPVGGKKMIEVLLESNKDVSVARFIAKRFMSNFSRLIMDYFGVHVARKAFGVLDIKDKAQVMEKEIVPITSKFLGSVHSNRFVTSVAVNQFAVNKKEWMKKFSEDLSKDEGKTKKKKKALKEEWEKELGLE